MKKGFTLIELLAVIVILGIIGLITTPMVLNYVKESKEDSIKISLDNIERAADMYFVSNNIKQDTVIDLTSGLIELKNNNISKGLAVGNRKDIKIYIYQNGYCGIKDGNKITVKKTTIKDCDFSINDSIEIITNNKVPKTKKILGYRIYGNTVNNVSLGDNNTIVLKLNGKNLINLPFIDSSKGEKTLNVNFKNDFIFSISSENAIVSSNIWRIRFTYSDGSMKYILDVDIGNGETYSQRISASSSKYVTKITYRATYMTSGKYTNIQLEEGTEATPYEPYLEPKEYEIKLTEPLRKYGNKVDYIDSSINQIVRNVGVKADGTLYELEKPTYEYIKLPSITNLEGTTIISSSDGNISSSKIEVIVDK